LDKVELEIQKLMGELKKLDLKAFNQVSVIFAGMAGAGNKSNKSKLEMILGKVIEKNTPFFVDNDAITALYSGSLGQEGIVNISGTGSIAYGINRDGKRERVGGWGYLLGDPGSGFSVGKEALTTLLDGYDKGRGITLLDTKIIQHFSIKEPPDSIPIIYGNSDSRRLVASIVPLVFSAADEGDNVARSILRNTATAIAENIWCLAPKLFSPSEKQIPVVLTGGLFTREEWFVPTIKGHLGCKSMTFDLIVPSIPPVVGSVFGGYKMLEKEFDHDFIQRLKSSLISKEGKK
jgi:N-acetylglucosamine kinase-like BadF-type ATPase